MSNGKPRPLRDLLETGCGGVAATLLNRARVQQNLTLQARKLLPANLDRHLQAAVVRDGLLVLVADSPAFASRLRYCGSAVLTGLGLPAGTTLRVKVGTLAPGNSMKRAPERRTLSAQSADLLRRVASTIEDAHLREAMLRLASRQNR